jgi:hypothetical protein
VEGVVQASSSADASTDDLDTDRTSLIGGGSIADSDYRDSNRNVTWTQICSGDFINAIPFFTEAPNIETVKTVSLIELLVYASFARSKFSILTSRTVFISISYLEFHM